MRISMGLRKNDHGVYQVRKKVPKGLEEVTATVLGNGKPRQSWLQASLGTKDLREAKVRAKPAMMKFDRILAEAKALTADRPLRNSLSQAEINRIAEYHFASMLADDDEYRREGGGEELFQSMARQLIEAGVKLKTPFKIGSVPEYGLSDREMHKIGEGLDADIPWAEHALARGDISHINEYLDELLYTFRLRLDPRSTTYKQLGVAVLRQHVNALHAIARRHKGEPIETPKLPDVGDSRTVEGGALRAALAGWKKVKRRPPNTLREFDYAVDRFVELHGDMPVAKITRRHVREFREALQQMPLRRAGPLRRATLPELLDWSSKHRATKTVSAATVNKILGGVQAIVVWARDNGLIPDEVPWADPFSNMRLDEEVSTREPWESSELQMLFQSPVFSQGARPTAGGGEAAFWLPLLGLFTGARLGELTPLTAADVTTDQATGIPIIVITEDREQERRLKTAASARVVPVHAELVRLGFMRFVQQVRRSNGSEARLFPALTRGPKGGLGEGWSKWFGRYIRSIGITNRASVFHSFRHGFKDALRAAGLSEDINDALTGHAGSGSVGRSYGAKEMVRRFGLPRLAEAVAKVAYPGLDLSHLHCVDAERVLI
jgi:integrase